MPGGVRVTGTTASSITLGWTAASGTVTGYRVYEGSTVRATVTGTSATFSGLAACTSRTFTVAAYNDGRRVHPQRGRSPPRRPAASRPTCRATS